MTKAVRNDLQRLKALAFDRAESAAGLLSRYHALAPRLSSPVREELRQLYEWLFVPISLWPFNIENVLAGCLTSLERGRGLNRQLRLLIGLLPERPDTKVCDAVAEHERHVQQGRYEQLLNIPAKYAQYDLATRLNSELRRQWSQIKAAFDVAAYRDHKGVVRRSMSVERNLRPAFRVNLRQRAEVFQAAFDAFCLRWNLYGMQQDQPLPLKLAVNVTPYGTMIHIPSYWSFDPKRDIKWDAIAKLHRLRVPRRQGSVLAEGLADRLKAAVKLRRLDREARRRGLRGAKKHEFLCAGLGWDPRTSPKRLARLRTEFSGTGVSPVSVTR